MVDTVLLHARSDAELALQLARTLPGLVAVPCLVEGDGPALQFGAHMQVFGVWTARSEEAAGARLQDTLDAAPRRAALFVWDNRRPPTGTGDGRTPSVAVSDDLADATARIADVAKSLRLGIFVASSSAPPPARQPAAPSPKKERALAEVPVAPRERAPAVARHRPSEEELRRNRNAGRWGFVVGALIGGAIVVAGLAPWASNIIQRERAGVAAQQAVPTGG